MKLLFENWNKFINETSKDTYGSEVVDRNKATFKNALVEEEKISPDQAIADEGGALGFSKWEELTGMSREELEKYVEDNDHIKIHKHGDIIDTTNLCKDDDKEVDLEEGSNFFDNMRKKKERCKGRKTGDCAEKRPTAKAWKKITAEHLNKVIKEVLSEQEYYEVDALDEKEEYCPNCRHLNEKKKKKACKPSKGKRFAKRVNGKCRSFGQAGKAKSGGDRIRPGTKKGDAYCARSAGIKKCKNPPCANTLSRKKWKCRGKKSMKEEIMDEGHGLTTKDVKTVKDMMDILKFIVNSNVEQKSKRKNLSKGK
jgi:hypothetical protein